MPSKIQHEIDKVRGRVSVTNKIYNDSIAALKDALTAAEVSIKALESNEIDNTSKINNALSMSRNAIKSAKASIKRTGDVLEGTFFPDVQDKYTLGFLGREWGNIYSSVVTAKNYIKTDTIDEYTTNAGITVDGMLIKDGDVAGAVMEADFTNRSVILCNSAGNPTITAFGTNTILGRAAAAIGALSSSQVRGIINVADGADVTGSNAPQTHGASVHTDRTRKIFIIDPYYYTGTLTSEGISLSPDAVQNAYYGFRLPEDFVSLTSVKMIYYAITPAAAEQYMIFDFGATFGSNSQNFQTHNNSDTDRSITVAAWEGLEFKEHTLLASLFTNITKDDFVKVKIERDADHGSDTETSSVRIIGILIEYTADM